MYLAEFKRGWIELWNIFNLFKDAQQCFADPFGELN